MKVEFDEKTGGVLRLRTAAGVDLASPRCGPLPLWEIELVKPDCFTNRVKVLASEAKETTIARKDGTVEIVFRDAGAVKEAVCTVWTDPWDTKLRWRIAVTPAEGWALYMTEFPRFRLTDSIGPSPADDAFLAGLGHSGILRNPCVAGNPFWKIWSAGRQPGALAAAFATYYDATAGFYCACEDPEGHVKEYSFRADGFAGCLFRWRRFNYSEKRDVQPYDIVTAAFDGSPEHPIEWYDAADLYKEWAVKQRWCRTPLVKRTDLPAWTKDAPAMMAFYTPWIERPDLIRRFFTEYWSQNFPGVPVAAALVGWEKHGEWMAPDYFPMHPSDEVTSRTFRDLKTFGAHPWPWPSGHFWTLTCGLDKESGRFRLDLRDDFEKRGGPVMACRAADGNVNTVRAAHLRGGETACLCPGTQRVREFWNEAVVMELVKRGAEMIQADQDTGAHVLECWSRDHGHSPGEGLWKTTSMYEQFASAIQCAREVEPDFIMTFEEPNEHFNDLLWIQDHRNCRFQSCGIDGDWEWADVFGYLYHEYLTLFQSDVINGNRFWWTYAAVEGHMPYARFNIADVFPEEDPKNRQREDYLEFLAQWTKLYHGEGRPWLAHGKHFRPPRFLCQRVKYSHNWRGKTSRTDMPAVFHTAYESPDGRKALVFGNATDKDQNAAYFLNGRWTRIWFDPHELRLVEIP